MFEVRNSIEPSRPESSSLARTLLNKCSHYYGFLRVWWPLVCLHARVCVLVCVCMCMPPTTRLHHFTTWLRKVVVANSRVYTKNILKNRYIFSTESSRV